MRLIREANALERALIQLLDQRDRETVSGDLLEEKHARQQQFGSLHAELWYARQVLSFLPHLVRARLSSSPALATLCMFTALCGFWLCAMDFRLRHPGYLVQAAIAASIVLQASLTLIAILCNAPVTKILAGLGTIGLLILAAKALLGVAHSPHFEGYIVLVAVALVLQSILTLIHIRRPSASTR